MNLRQLRESCRFRSGYNDDNYNDQWNSFINEAVREAARRYPWDGLEDVITLTSDGTKFLILPPFVDTVIHLYNKSFFIPVDRGGSWDREASAIYGQQTPGRVINYDRIGEVATLRDPTGYLWLKSSHASDLQSLYVTGRINNSGASGTGLQSTISTLAITSTGTSPITLSTLFSQVVSISKTTDANGDFFFYDAGASNAHISFLGQYDDEARFKRLQLLYKPADQTIFELRFRYKIPPLKNDAQSPHPSIKPDFTVHHALSLHYEQQQQFSKSSAKSAKALQVLQDEANKDANFDEPYAQIVPQKIEDDPDVWSDGYWRLT